MIEVWEVARLLKNPQRRKLLRMVCECPDGLNVTIASDESSKLNISGASQYLKQLMKIGFIRRMKSGKYVNYTRNAINAPPEMREIAIKIEERYRSRSGLASVDERFVSCLPALANAERARIAAYLHKVGPRPIDAVKSLFDMNYDSFARNIKSLLQCSLVEYDKSSNILKPIPQEDPITNLLLQSIT